jgi:hypothetical protein
MLRLSQSERQTTLLPLECVNALSKINDPAYGKIKMDLHPIVDSASTIDKSNVQTILADGSCHADG